MIITIFIICVGLTILLAAGDEYDLFPLPAIGAFADVASESSVTLVALYPELKADTLVQSQINIYVANNETIKRLREQQINGNIKRLGFLLGESV